MNKLSKILAASLSILAVSTCVSSAQADWYQRIHRQATLLHGQARELGQQTKPYKDASNYQQMVSDMREIADLAKHLQSISRSRGRLTHIENDLAELDRRYERLERRLESSRSYMTRGRGGIGEGHLRYVTKLMQSMENNIDATQNEAAKMRAAYELDRQQRFNNYLQTQYQNQLYNRPVIYQTQYVPTYVPNYSPTVVTTWPNAYTYTRTTRVVPRNRAGVSYNSRTGRGRVRIGGGRIGF